MSCQTSRQHHFSDPARKQILPIKYTSQHVRSTPHKSQKRRSVRIRVAVESTTPSTPHAVKPGMGFESRTQLSAFRLVCRRHPNLLASIFVLRSRSFLSGTLVCCWHLCNRTMRLKSWTVQTTGRKEWRSGYMDKLAGTNYMYTGTHICLLLIDHGTAQDSTVQHGDKDKDTKRSLARNK